MRKGNISQILVSRLECTINSCKIEINVLRFFTRIKFFKQNEIKYARGRLHSKIVKEIFLNENNLTSFGLTVHFGFLFLLVNMLSSEIVCSIKMKCILSIGFSYET
jgi:hypothetical protein